jgi:hypothetical protein
MEKVLTGLAYMKIQGTKKQTTTVTWEPQVWRAFHLLPDSGFLENEG